MLLELARPVTLLSSILACFAAFHAAFFGTATGIDERMGNAIPMLVLALGISLLSGLVFMEGGLESGINRQSRSNAIAGSSEFDLIVLRLWKTLPVQIFCWITGLIVVLFLASWYVETHVILYRDLHYGIPGARSTSSFVLRIHWIDPV